MKKVLFLPNLIVTALLFFSCNDKAKTTDLSVKVWGNCEKCKNRIETICKVDGVELADWHTDSKLLVLKLDTNVVKSKELLKLLSNGGHDNEFFFADDYAYSKLPECCQYERRSE